MVLLSVAEVEEIENRLRHGPTEPLTNPQGTWHPIDRALQFKNARRGLLYLHKNKPCPQLGGDILHAKRFRRMVPKTYRKSMVWAFLEADLERLAPPQPGGTRHRKKANVEHKLGANNRQTPKRRGRPEGTVDKEVEKRKADMIAAWERGEFKTRAAAARAFNFHRPDASKIINAHDRKKRRNNSGR
jgi:hypothetical protein